MSLTLALFAMAVGLVSAGIVGSLWQLLFDEEPRFAFLLDRDPTLLTPVRALAVVFSAPSILGTRAMWWLVAQPMIGVPLAVLVLGWSFVQGVFILTQVFGFK